jgi:DNA adenine methylase
MKTRRAAGTLTALAPWFGSKRQLASRIVEALGPHESYYEPFCGSMAVLFAKPPARLEVVNDLNRDLVNVSVVLQSRLLAAELLARLHFTMCAEELYRAARDAVLEPYVGHLGNVERAYNALVTWWLGRNGCAGTRKSRTSFAARFSARGGSGAVRWRSLVASVPRFVERLARVDVLNRDGIGVVGKIHDCDGAAIYVDPPYVVKSQEYEHDLTPHDHGRLAEALSRFRKARVVVSYYPHPEIDRLYPRDRWDHVPLVVTKNIRNTDKREAGAIKATELLIINRRPGDESARAECDAQSGLFGAA